MRTTRLKRDRVAKRTSSCEQLLMTSLAAEAPAPEEKAPSGPAPAREAITTAKKDTQRPSAPKPLNLSSRTKNSLGLGWGASTDDRGVVGYRVYRGSSQVGTTTSLAYTLDSLACGTNYTVTVTAVDAAGNESNKAQSTTSTTTLACDAAPPPAPDTAAPSVPQGMAWATVTQTAIGVRWMRPRTSGRHRLPAVPGRRTRRHDDGDDLLRERPGMWHELHDRPDRDRRGRQRVQPRRGIRYAQHDCL